MKKNSNIIQKRKYIVISTKGGVGKSVTCSQILAPYIFSRTGEKVSYYEIDDANKNIEILEESQIVNAAVVELNNAKKFLFNSAMDEETHIIDCGGNLTAQTILSHLNSISYQNGNEVYLIPIKCSEIDIKTGIDTYDQIRKFDQNGKIIFVLNEAFMKEDEFLFFFGDEALQLFGIWNLISEHDKNVFHLKLERSENIEMASFLKRTVYEIANMSYEDTILKINAARAAGDRPTAVYNLRISSLIKDAREYQDKELTRVFRELDEILS